MMRLIFLLKIMVNLITTEHGSDNTKTCLIDNKCTNKLSVFVEQAYSISLFENNEVWVILDKAKKIEEKGLRLTNWNININYGIKTVYNDT